MSKNKSKEKKGAVKPPFWKEITESIITNVTYKIRCAVKPAAHVFLYEDDMDDLANASSPLMSGLERAAEKAFHQGWRDYSSSSSISHGAICPVCQFNDMAKTPVAKELVLSSLLGDSPKANQVAVLLIDYMVEKDMELE